MSADAYKKMEAPASHVVLSPSTLASVHRAANTNPLRELLRSTRVRTATPQEDVVSIVWWLLAAVASVAAGLALYYVLKETPKFADVSSNSVRIMKALHATTVTLGANDADYHYVALTPTTAQLLSKGVNENPYFTVELPPLSSMRTGRFVSIALPMTPGAASDTRFLKVQCAQEDAGACGIIANGITGSSGAMWMVARDLGVKRWKLVRVWPI